MTTEFGSVCSGIEAASEAWRPLGWRAAWLSETDRFASAVLAHRHPAAVNVGDMTFVPEWMRLGLLPAPDVLVGGTPCQAFSVAGLRRSLADARGNLSLTFCEIANEIDNSRRARGEPECVVVWENVPGVLSTADNAFGCFLAGLAGEDGPLVPAGKRWSDAGCVYGPARAVAWRVLDAQYFGLAQRRRRVFVVASARNGFDPPEILFEFGPSRRDSAPSREARTEVTRTLTATAPARRSDHAPLIPCWWNGDQISQTGDAVLYKLQTMPEKNRFPAVIDAQGLRFATPREWERLFGFPDDYTLVPVRGKPAADGPRYKALGNSMAVPVMRWIGSRIANALASAPSACPVSSVQSVRPRTRR